MGKKGGSLHLKKIGKTGHPSTQLASMSIVNECMYFLVIVSLPILFVPCNNIFATLYKSFILLYHEVSLTYTLMFAYVNWVTSLPNG